MTDAQTREEQDAEAAIDADLLARFHNHNLTDEQYNVVEHLREAILEVARDLCGMTNPSREQSLALTHLEDALMWAVKGVARHGVQ
jgi:hypothetical protein